MTTSAPTHRSPAAVAVIGAGPAGLMAAEAISEAGYRVTVYDRMPSPGRKLLMAGKSGLNVTHAEPSEDFLRRYGVASERIRGDLARFDGAAVRAWAAGLGTETFVGSSGRVFPTAMKASPLLRAWLRRLADRGVAMRVGHRWVGWDGGRLAFETASGVEHVEPAATVLALGGASWPRLGSDAAWVPWLSEQGVNVVPFRPANCGFDVDWTPVFAERFAGVPVKTITATSAAGTIAGELVVTAHGIEGSLVYAHAAALRDALTTGPAVLTLDLAPGRDVARLARDLERQRRGDSFGNRLRKGAGLDAAKVALVRELTSAETRDDTDALAAAIKALPLPVVRPRPIAEAISVAGGIGWDGLTPDYELRALPGVFACGEMLDWEAPTGGYLLTGCFATGRAAGEGVKRLLAGRQGSV